MHPLNPFSGKMHPDAPYTLSMTDSFNLQRRVLPLDGLIDTFYAFLREQKMANKFKTSSPEMKETQLMSYSSAPIAHTWDLKIGKCHIHTQLVTGIIGRQNHNVANTTGVTNMVS